MLNSNCVQACFRFSVLKWLYTNSFFLTHSNKDLDYSNDSDWIDFDIVWFQSIYATTIQDYKKIVTIEIHFIDY